MIKKFKARLENKQSIEKKRKVYSKKVHSNKKVIKTKTNKKTIGGALINEEKDMKELKKLLFKMYPTDGNHLSSKTIDELQLKNVNDLMYLTRESINDFLKNKLNKEDEKYQSQIRACLLFLSEKLKKELSMLKKKLEKKFSEDISNKIINELGLRNVNDLINATENEIKSYEEEIGIPGLLLLRKELKKRQGLLKARLKKMFSGNISIIIRELKLTDIYDLSKLKDDDMAYLYERLNHTDEIKNKIFKLPEMLSDNYQMLINEMLRYSFSRDEIKMIIRELMLFEISDLAFVSIEEIDNLSLTKKKLEIVHSFHIEEFNKFMLKKMFNDTTTKIEAKKSVINYITLKLPDIYQLMEADDSKIEAIDFGNYFGNLTVSIQEKLKKLRVSLLQDSLLPDSRIKTNRIKSNSRSNSRSNSS